MDLDRFKHDRVEGRKLLLEKIISVFRSVNPIAIHQFGSGIAGFKDELSDIDVWITLRDEDIEPVLKKLPYIFKSIAPVLVRHYSSSWSPVGGSANSVIHDTQKGLFIVDYYISKYSETIIPKDSAVLFGSEKIKKGTWRLHKTTNVDVHDSHTREKDINMLLNLIYISSKGIVRKWSDESFVQTLKSVHRRLRRKNTSVIKRRVIRLDFRTNYRLLSDLYPLADDTQKKAIEKIKKYLEKVESLYFNQPQPSY